MKIEIVENSDELKLKNNKVVTDIYRLHGWIEGYQFQFSEYDPEYKTDSYFDDLEFFNEDRSPKKFTIYLDYPLSVIVKSEVEVKSNFEIAIKIADIYHQIYKEESETSTIEVGVSDFTYNRNKTNGKYGIWGHELGDLVLEGVQIREGDIITAHIGS